MEELASHGYAVYSIQHTGESAATAFPNGDIIPWDPSIKTVMKTSREANGDYKDAIAKGIGATALDERLLGQVDWISRRQNDGERMISSEKVWVQDRLFIHDTLQNGDVPESVLDIVAKSNFERTGQIGMSFGGMATGTVCAFDERCVAGVNLDGSVLHASVFAHELPQPFMVFYSDHDFYYNASLCKKFLLVGLKEDHWLYDFSYEGFETAGQRSDIHRIELSQVAHAGLTDSSLFMRRPLRNSSLGSAPTEVILGAQNDFVRDFFDTYLRGLETEFPHAPLEEYSGYTERRDTSHIRDWWQSTPEDERAALRDQLSTLMP